MPVTERFCLSQVKRLREVPYFPAAAADREMLVVALASACLNEEHATAVIDTAIEEYAHGCPKAGELKVIARDMAAKFREVKKFGCSECIEGWRQAWMLTTYGDGAPLRERITEEQYRALLGKPLQRQAATAGVGPCRCRMGVAS